MLKKVLFRGKEVDVTDTGLTVGKKLVNFKAVDKNLEDVNLDDYKGKIVVINSFPSIDTGICALQTLRFNNEVKNYDDLVVITVSKDLPFALSRFCGEKNVENAVTLSDYKYRDFENKFGGLMEDNGLLARQVFVADKNGTIQYYELVKEVSSEPDYNAALDVIKTLL